jgi:hypothetical protein
MSLCRFDLGLISAASDLNLTPGTEQKFLTTAIGFDDTRVDFGGALKVAGYFSLTDVGAQGILRDTPIGLRKWREVAYKKT